MLELKNINIKLKNSNRVLINNLNINFNQDDKIAIIGEEGNGKTTLLKLIYDNKLIEDYCFYEGQIIKKNDNIGYLEQNLNIKWDNHTIFEYLLKNNPDDNIDYDKYNELTRYTSILSKFKIDSKVIESDRQIKTLSGGEKIKLQLAKIIVNESNILLLDEPTNDLDIETLEWLENFINSTNIPIMYISHDETLLERTANVIIHLEQIKRKTEAKHTIQKIGYKDYVEKRLEMISKQTQVAKKQRAVHKSKTERWREIYQKVEYQQDTITRADPHGARLLAKKMKSLKSQEKRMENEENNFLEIPDVEESIDFNFESNISIPNNKLILDLKLDRLKINDKLLASNINLEIRGSKHVVIIGRNGVGKTTLFKEIYKLLENRKDIIIGYMPQNYDDLFDLNQTALSFLLNDRYTHDETRVRTFMGSMKFTHEEMLYKISNLSGGQRAKLLILKMILNNCNVLLLDEPTRNLSPLSNPVIRKVLSNYNGTIISISHDRKYIDEVCDETYELTESELILKSNYKTEKKDEKM